MNEQGLYAGSLYLVESSFNHHQCDDDNRPEIGIAILPQYFLDNFKTVAEAIEDFTKGGVVDVNGRKQSRFKVIDAISATTNV